MVPPDTNTTASTPTDGSLHVVHNGEPELDRIVSDNDIVVTAFTSARCVPCHVLEPTVRTVVAEMDSKLVKVDIEENRDLTRSYEIDHPPALVVFDDGDQVVTVDGTVSEKRLRALIQSLDG